jgi:hypothetical protein
MKVIKKVLQAVGLNWLVPNFSTISRRRKELREVFMDLRKPPGLHLVVDDDGIQLMTLGGRESRYWAGNRDCQWVKVELIVELKSSDSR